MQPLSWYWNRLSLMSIGEVGWRARRATLDRFAMWRIAKPVPTTKGPEKCMAPWVGPPQLSVDSHLYAAENILAGRIDLYGRWVQVGSPDIDWNRDPTSGVQSPSTYGKTLDYRDSQLVGSARDIWEINRHFQLVTLAQAWAVTRDERFHAGAKELIASWLRACPYPLGINWSSALEHGIRLINWYLAARLLQIESIRPIDGWLESIYRHSEFIWENQSRYSSANNHLIGEMAGLYVAACGWDCWDVSPVWRRQAKRVLEREATRQVTSDGVGREQTVGYQIFVLQFLIIAGLVGERHGDGFSTEYWDVVKRMIRFLRSIVDVGGHLPNFGDSDDGMVYMLSSNARGARLTDLLELDSAFSTGKEQCPATTGSTASWLLSGFEVPGAWKKDAIRRQFAFPEGGYFILGTRFGEPQEVSLVFDAAPLGYLSIAAHGHADCLSFVLSLSGEQILIDPGTFCYHSDAAWRDYFRSTAAHNTVGIDGADQSEMGGAFMWLRKARPFVDVQQLGGPIQRVRARHDGYQRLTDPVLHSRDLTYDTEANSIVVADEIRARNEHLVRRFWHFSEGCNVSVSDDQLCLTVEALTSTVEFKFDRADSISLYRGSESPRAGWVSHAFGARSPITTAVVQTNITGSDRLTTAIRWRFR